MRLLVDLMVEIRRATVDDIDWLLSELKEFAKFFGTGISFYGDEMYSRQALENVLNDHVAFIAQHTEHGPIGFVVGLVTQHIFNPQVRVLTELFWWVTEKHRKSRAGLLLLEVFIKWGREHADLITIALEHQSPINENALIKRGFHLHERSYILTTKVC